MLYIILTCAIMLPLIISIFRDSKIYGNQLSVQQQTHGQTYHIINAKIDYLKYFKNIQGLSSYYEDSTIFINIKSDEEAKNPEREVEYKSAIFSIINEINDDKLILINMSQLGTDESIDKFPNQLLYVNAFVIILSLGIIQSAYKNHLNKFAPDIGVLVACGAENRQIRKLFLFEFFITFIISALSAVAMSSALMYLLFTNFLQVKNIGNLAWLIFRVDPINVVGHILIFGIFLLLVIILCLNYKLRHASIKLLSSNESGEKVKHYRDKLKIKKNADETLGRLLFQRTKSRFISCLIVSVPITIAVLFIFNYLMINIETVSQSPEYEITISKNTLIESETGISIEDIELVKGMDGIQRVKEECNISPNKYLIKDGRMDGPSLVENENERYAMTNIYSYNEIKKELIKNDFNLEKYNIAISKNHKYLKYKVGDKLYLYLNEIGLVEEHDDSKLGNSNILHNDNSGKLSIVSKPIELTIVQLLDDEWTDRMFSIYFTDELYQELTKGEPVLTLQLKIDNPSESKAIESILISKFIDVEYTITNNQEMFEKNRESVIGVYLMALAIFSIMLSFILVILYVNLADYVESQSKNIHLFYILGATKSDIYNSYMRLPLNVSMFSIGVSFIFGLGLCVRFFQNTGYYLIMNITTIGVHLIIAALILIAFNIPVHLTLKNKLNRF